MGSGTIFKAITKRDLESLLLPWPDEELAAIADGALSPAISTIRRLASANRELAAIRGLLLPKLVTGEIDVSSLDLDSSIGAVP